MPQPEHFPGLPVVVGPEWLTEHYGEVLVADVRWYLDGRSGRDAHLGGHLPGAVFVDLDADLAAPATEEGGRHPLPDPEAFARALGALGIGDDTPVVGYDDAGGSTAARLVWMLRALGSPAAVLDGGIQAWPGVLEQGPVPTAPRHRTPAPWPAERVADTSAVRAATADGARLLLDARAHGRYTGAEPSPVDVRPGHIPGARSAAWQDNLGPDGRFAAPERLRERFAGLGAAEAGSVTAYCGSGVTACHDLLALEHAGSPVRGCTPARGAPGPPTPASRRRPGRPGRPVGAGTPGPTRPGSAEAPAGACARAPMRRRASGRLESRRHPPRSAERGRWTAVTESRARTRAELSRILMRTGPRIAQLQRRLLGRLDPPLGLSQYSVLARLGRGTTSMSELRARSIVSFSTLSETTAGLVRLGLVERTASERDRRSVDLSLTDKGRRLLAEAEQAMDQMADSIVEGVRPPSEAELSELLTPLADRVREVLAAEERGEPEP